MPHKFREIFTKHKINGCIAIKDTSSLTSHIFNHERAQTRFIPASTFKIINALIALEVGAIKPEERLDWDKSPVWNEAQKNTLNIHEAFKLSAVWFFKILAKRIGGTNYQKYLAACEYGNCDCGHNAEKFWLNGCLVISPLEQLNFIEKLRTNNLPFEKENISLVKEMMLVESSNNYIFRAKTGFIDENANYGWHVGYLETEKNQYSFVTHLDIPNLEMLTKREIITKECLANI